MAGKLRCGAGRHLYTFQAGESKSRRDQVRGGGSQEAGRQETKSGQSLGHEAADTKARSGRWKGCILRALGSYSGAGSQGGEVPTLEAISRGRNAAQAGSGQAEPRTSH